MTVTPYRMITTSSATAWTGSLSATGPVNQTSTRCPAVSASRVAGWRAAPSKRRVAAVMRTAARA